METSDRQKDEKIRFKKNVLKSVHQLWPSLQMMKMLQRMYWQEYVMNLNVMFLILWSLFLISFLLSGLRSWRGNVEC